MGPLVRLIECQNSNVAAGAARGDGTGAPAAKSSGPMAKRSKKGCQKGSELYNSPIKAAVNHCRRTLGTRAEELTGKTESYLYKCSHPDEEGRNLSVKDAVALDVGMRAAGHGNPIFDAYAALLAAMPSARAGGCAMRAFLDIAERIGPLAATITNGMSDGKLDLHERREISEAAQDLIDQVRHLLDTIEVPRATASAVPAAVTSMRRGDAA